MVPGEAWPLLRGALFAAAMFVTACSRTPEPTPSAVTSEPRIVAAPRTSDAVTTTSRCLSQVSAVAPPIPKPADSSLCPTDPEPNLKLPLADVTFPDAPSSPRLEVEIAKTPHDVERGLMYRRSMADDRGMLFTLDGRREHAFWMRNTCIPLDMLFIDDDGLIVGIVEGATPLTETTRSVGCSSLFVIEVNAGWTRRRGVKPGQKVTIPFAAR